MSDNQPNITESSILQTYLLTPSSLPTILPFSTFTTLAPANSRNNPQLKTLYRDLQFHRTVTTDTLRSNISRECRRSIGLQAALSRSIRAEQGSRKRRREQSESDDEIDRGTLDEHIDETLYPAANAGLASASTQSRYHDMESLLEAMEKAVEELEDEIGDLDRRAAKTLEELDENVGALSDLRYGKFARVSEDHGVEESVVEGLKGFVNAAQAGDGGK